MTPPRWLKPQRESKIGHELPIKSPPDARRGHAFWLLDLVLLQQPPTRTGKVGTTGAASHQGNPQTWGGRRGEARAGNVTVTFPQSFFKL